MKMSNNIQSAFNQMHNEIVEFYGLEKYNQSHPKWDFYFQWKKIFIGRDLSVDEIVEEIKQEMRREEQESKDRRDRNETISSLKKRTSEIRKEMTALRDALLEEAYIERDKTGSWDPVMRLDDAKYYSGKTANTVEKALAEKELAEEGQPFFKAIANEKEQKQTENKAMTIEIDLSLKNEVLYAGCSIEEVAGRLNLTTPVDEAVNIVGRNIAAIVDGMSERDEIVLTGPMAVWSYLVVFHAVVHRFKKVFYDDGRGNKVLVAAHG